MASGSDDLLDRIIPDTYLGFGGTAKVFSARYKLPDGTAGERVAVKAINVDERTKDVRIAEARSECESLRAIDRLEISSERKLRIVRPKEIGWSHYKVDAGAVGSRSFTRTRAATPQLIAIYPLIEGKELFDIVKVGGLPEQVTKYFLRRMLDAVAVCHSAGVAHRDLKLDNIMVTRADCDIRVIDFGMSAIASDTGGVRSTRGGTLMYNSPDRHGRVVGVPMGKKGPKYDAFKADVWALGVCAFTLLTGRLPYSATKPGTRAYRDYSDPRQDCPAYNALSSGDWERFWAYHASSGVDLSRLTRDASGFKTFLQAMLTWDPRARASLSRMSTNPWLFGDAAAEVGLDVVASELKKRDDAARAAAARAAASASARVRVREAAGGRSRAEGGTSGASGSTASRSPALSGRSTRDGSAAGGGGSGSAPMERGPMSTGSDVFRAMGGGEDGVKLDEVKHADLRGTPHVELGAKMTADAASSRLLAALEGLTGLTELSSDAEAGGRVTSAALTVEAEEDTEEGEATGFSLLAAAGSEPTQMQVRLVQVMGGKPGQKPGLALLGNLAGSGDATRVRSVLYEARAALEAATAVAVET